MGLGNMAHANFEFEYKIAEMGLEESTEIQNFLVRCGIIRAMLLDADETWDEECKNKAKIMASKYGIEY